MNGNWLIYGAYGYTGELIVQEAVRRGLHPVIAGRNAEKLAVLAAQFQLETRTFPLDGRAHEHLQNIDLVLHCAGPFSETSKPMIEACLASGAHYLDITGEIPVFEHTHAQHERAIAAGVVLCSGVGFDVIPTDCTALKLKEILPDATQLALGFDSDSGISPGTYKTAVRGLGSGSAVRRNGSTSPAGGTGGLRQCHWAASIAGSTSEGAPSLPSVFRGAMSPPPFIQPESRIFRHGFRCRGQPFSAHACQMPCAQYLLQVRCSKNSALGWSKTSAAPTKRCAKIHPPSYGAKHRMQPASGNPCASKWRMFTT